MKKISDWTLDVIRDDITNVYWHWLEERRHDWVGLVEKIIVPIVEEGASIIIASDNDRSWICKYAINYINKVHKNRPIMPIVQLEAFIPQYMDFLRNGHLDLITDALNTTFESSVFWYIGQGNHQALDVAKEQNQKFLWILDEEISNTFYLRSNDDLIDFKLLHLIRLFDKTLDAFIFGEVDLD